MAPRISSRKAGRLHKQMVRGLKDAGMLTTPAIEAAFEAVPRHLFLPNNSLDDAYRDEPVPIKVEYNVAISGASQPSMMAIMLNQLALEPGMNILEIGTATGYNAALLAHIVGTSGHVTSVEIDQDVSDFARQNLNTAGFKHVQTICADGGLGDAPNGPYDRIIVTVGASDIPPAWWEQLKPGGRLVLPLEVGSVEYSLALDRCADHFESASASICSFMRMRGQYASSDKLVLFGANNALMIRLDDPSRFDADHFLALLNAPGRYLATGVYAGPQDIWRSFSPWLSLRRPDFCSFMTRDMTNSDAYLVQPLFVGPTWRSTLGLMQPDSLVFLTRPPGSEESDQVGDTGFSLYVFSQGPDDSLAEQLISEVRSWHQVGTFQRDLIYMRAYPLDSAVDCKKDEIQIAKRSVTLVIGWQHQD